MKFAICNEFCEGWDLDRVFRLAADSGYEGVEIAPGTLAAEPRTISAGRRRELAAQAAAAGVEVVGLHWLLAGTKGLHITHPDPAIRSRTTDYLKELIRLCADLGGRKMVIGSPRQRDVLEGVSRNQAWDHAREVFAGLLDEAGQHGVDLCLEPLARSETNFINTAAEGLRLCQELGHPRFRLHLDVKAMADEGRPLDEIVASCKGWVAHVHVNDANLSYPGSGDTDLRPLAAGLSAIGYDEWLSVEVFDFKPGPETIARESRRYLANVFAGSPPRPRGDHYS